MNFWQFLLICFHWIGNRATRALGLYHGLVALALLQCIGPDGKVVEHPLVPVKWIPWMIFTGAAATYLRGQFVSNRVDEAKAIIAAQPKDPPPIPLSQPSPEKP